MDSINLGKRAKKGFVWNTIERIATNGIQFVLTIILARLLSPDDYGIIAMPAIFLAIAQVFIDSGFANALIRKQDLSEIDLSTAFFFNILVGFVSYLILFFSSPLIASYFKTPILSQLLKVTALVVFINSLGIVQQAVMTKRMDFKTQAIISAVSTCLSGLIGVWMAYNGYGVWALVFQQVSAALLRTSLFWYYGKWKPLWMWSNESFQYLWTYGNKVVIVGLLDSIFNNVYAFIIGKRYSAKELGNYTRSQQFVDLPVNNINGIVQKVTLPLLSEIQDDNTRLSTIYFRLIELISFLFVPLMIGLAAMANPIIITLLGNEWEGCVLLFQILCFAKIWTPINAINLNVLHVKARTDLLLRVEIGKKAVLAIVIGVTFSHGVIILLSGYACCSIFIFLINAYYTKQLIGISIIKQLKVVIPSFLLSISLFGIAILLNSVINNNLIKMLIDILIFVLGTITFLSVFKRDLLIIIKENVLVRKNKIC